MSVAQITTSKNTMPHSSAPFQILLAKAGDIRSYDQSKIITTVNYDTTHLNSPDSLYINLPPLEPTELTEVWLARDSLVSGKDGEIEFRKNNELLFGKICLDENQFDSLEQCSNYAYTSILNFINKKEFPYLIRIWNFFANINQVHNSLDRYQSFCVGRYNALQDVTEFERLLPAATAIGTGDGKFIIYFIATAKAGVQVENPRQISAYHYPKQYGPKSPTFARATLKHWQHVTQFFISGTASIVGHETLHEENVLIQLEEILKNIEALVTTVRDTHQQPIRDITGLSFMKVYIRKPEHYQMIQEALSHRIGNDVALLYLQGDICRDNLLMEIEAFAEFTH